MKKWFILLIFLYPALPFTAYGLDVPKLQGYVNDYASMISPSAKSRLEQELKAFEQSDSTQIVILTIPSLEEEDIEGFGIKVGDAWQIGQQKKDNGIILIVSKEDRKIRIEVGRGLEGRLTDLTAGRIIDGVITPRFRDGNFDGGFVDGVSSLIDATRGEFKSDQGTKQQRPDGIPPFWSFFFFLIFFTLIMGRAFRPFGGVAGAIGLPSLIRLTVHPIGIPLIILFGIIGFAAGYFLPLLFPSGGPPSSGYRGRRNGGFILGGGGWGGGSRGGFGGGGGSFGGGGASGGW
jgi:uncharacterized protein